MKKPVLTLCIILSLFNCPTFANSSYEQAQTAIQAYKYEEAIIVLRNLLDKEPKNIAAHMLLIEALLAQGKGDLAELELDKISNLPVEKNQLIPLMAEALIFQGKYNEAITLVESPNIQGINQDILLTKKAHAQLGMGYIEVAKKTFQDALYFNENNANAKVGLAQVFLIQHEI